MHFVANHVTDHEQRISRMEKYISM